MISHRTFQVPTEQVRLIRDHPLARGLKAFWLLTPRHGLVDLVARIPLTKNSTVGLVGQGQRGLGSNFDGGYWTAPTSPATKITTSAITLAAGLRTGTNTGTGRVIFGQPAANTHTSPFFYYCLYWDAGFNNLSMRLSADAIRGGSMGGSNTEYSCFGTYDGSTMTAYLDGVSAASAAHTGAVDSNTESLYIGANRDGGETFNGTIYYVAIWDVYRDVSDARKMHFTPFDMLEPDRKRRSVVVAATTPNLIGGNLIRSNLVFGRLAA